MTERIHTEYKMVRAINLDNFNEEINELLEENDGWELYGSPSVQLNQNQRPCMYQALVKYSDVYDPDNDSE